jgi:hypothetical protein
MWNHALQVFLVFAALVIALGIRSALIEHQAALPKLHRIYLLPATRVKKLRHHVMQWTWLAVLLIAVSALTRCESAPQPSFYPYGRFVVGQTKAQAGPTPTATPPHHQAYGRFGVVTSETQSP